MISSKDEVIFITPKWTIWTSYFKSLEAEAEAEAAEETRSSATSLGMLSEKSSVSVASSANPWLNHSGGGSKQSFSQLLGLSPPATIAINMTASSSNRSSSSSGMIQKPSSFHSSLLPVDLRKSEASSGDKKDQLPSMAWEELLPSISNKLGEIVAICSPFIKAVHFDGGVRYWLLKIASLSAIKKQGIAYALNALQTLQTATNLGSVRSMRAFLTTRLIDTYEQTVFQQGM